MEYWKGAMNWPVKDGWKCETCETTNPHMTWGLVHGQCRCNVCHTPYVMKNSNDDTVTEPISDIKEESKGLVMAMYERFKEPIDEIPDDDWETIKEDLRRIKCL